MSTVVMVLLVAALIAVTTACGGDDSADIPPPDDLPSLVVRAADAMTQVESARFEMIHEGAVVTIEGLSQDASHPVQRAWVEEDVPQCGYCQAGQIMAVVDLLQRVPEPTDEQIDAMHTNICRCGTYYRMRRAIHRAAVYLNEER